MNKTTQITIETHSITIIRASGRRLSAHCGRCGETVTAFAPEQIAAALQVDLAEVCRRVEAKQIHLTGEGDNVAMICANSLGGTETIQNRTRQAAEGEFMMKKINNTAKIIGLLLLSFLCFFAAAQTIDAAAGDLDLTFTPTGITEFSVVNDIAIQSDGKIIVAGVFFRMNGAPAGRIARLNADGSLDTTFAPAGGANGDISVVALQSDGKILIGGNFTSFSGTAINRVARLNADGSLDSLFSVGTGFNALVSDIAVQTDNKIVVVGNFTNVGGSAINRVVRLEQNGAIDSFNFNVGTGSAALVDSVAIETGGTILIGGDFTSFNGAPRNRIARLDSSGAVDSAFTPSINNNIDSLKLQTNGQILIGGTFTSITGVGGMATTRNRLARLNADGSLDSSFNPNVGGSTVHDIAVQSDGSLVFVGDFTSVGGQTRDGIGRVFASGAVDMSYTARFNDINPDGFAVAVQSNDAAIYGGLFQFVGLTTSSTKPCASLLRVNADGSIDLNFFAAAGVPHSINTVAVVQEIFVRASGKILVGGNFTAVGRFPVGDIGQLNADGTLDETFNVNGIGGNGQSVTAFAEQPDGKILVGGDGFTFFNSVARNSVARLNADGTIDASFTSGLSSGNDVNDIEVLADGRIVLVGSFSTYSGQPRSRIVVVNADGSLDTTVFINSGTGANGVINQVEVDADGKFLIGGNFTSYDGTTRNHIARINADGSLDTTFDPGSGFPPINGQDVNALELQPDGAIVVAGGLTSYNGTPRNRIARVNADGSLDTSFVPPTGVFGNRINQIALQADGKILVGGNFGTPAVRIARLNVDGSHDTSFNPPSGANDQVYAIAVQADRKILIGGAFTTVNGAIRSGIARLEPGEPIIWNGSSSTDWNTAANWTPAQVPTAQDLVIIPSAAPNNPVIGGAFSVNTLTVEAGKTATINGNLTTVSLFNNGTIDGAGTLILGGLTSINNGVISVADPRTNGGTRRVSGTGAFTSTFTINGGTLALGSNHQFSAITRTTGLLDLRTFTLRLNGAGNAFNFGGSLICFGACHLEFNGTSPQTTTGNGASGFLTINNPAGVTLTTNNLTISDNLTLTGGIFNVGSLTITLDSDATLTGTNGYVVGNLRKEFSAGAADFTFAVGTANGYSPVTLGGIVGAGDFTVRANEGTYPNAATGLTANRAARWWRLTNNGLTEADVSFNYVSGDITLGTESEYRAWRIPTGGGAATQIPGSINTTTRIVSAPNVQMFSDWTLAELAPTSAMVSVGGRVTANGRGLAKAQVFLLDAATGETRYALTNAFGYYRFDEVEVGQTYIVNVRHKQYEFSPRAINPVEELTDVDFENTSQNRLR